jgi:hypothetical protein
VVEKQLGRSAAPASSRGHGDAHMLVSQRVGLQNHDMEHSTHICLVSAGGYIVG